VFRSYKSPIPWGIDPKAQGLSINHETTVYRDETDGRVSEMGFGAFGESGKLNANLFLGTAQVPPLGFATRRETKSRKSFTTI
jgi:hypothetical protein